MAQLLPLLASTVDPDAEAHEDDPAGPADACDECGLLDHVGDLLSQAHVAFLLAAAAASIAWHGRLFSWWLCGGMEKGQKCSSTAREMTKIKVFYIKTSVSIIGA